jgi:tetratricopeptide (TPR) repeat protein
VSEGASSSQRLLQAGKLQEALAAAELEIATNPDDTGAVYCKAVAERYLERNENALETLAQLKSLVPHYARAWQEEGHVFRALGQIDRARAAYQQAVRLNSALPAAWRELAAIYQHQGDTRKHAAADAEYRRLSELPPELVSVSSLLQERKLYKAEQLCRAFLKKTPHHIEAMRLLALIGMQLFVYDDAEFLLESCVELQPDNWLARLDYIKVLRRRQKFQKALEQARILRDTHPENRLFELTLANENVAVGNFDEALDVYDRVIGEHPDFEQVHLSRGHALKTIGRLDEGVESYRGAYRARADFGDAFWSLANLKTYRFTDSEIDHMRDYVDRPETSDEDRFHFCFALGKAYEDRNEFEESFSWYERGNALRLAGLRYDPERSLQAMSRQAEICRAALFRDKAGLGSQRDDPIFVVGLPRSGSTLLEQILASHSQIDGTMELPNIIATAHRLNGRRLLTEEARYPAVLADLDGEQLRKLADAYIADTSVHRKGAPRFIDKMPNNFLHIGLIHLMFPNAKIIDARRHPMGCCFSGFKQLFADGQEFTYGLDEIARYYRAYVDLMKHWDRVLPGVVLRVHYENVVADTPAQVRRLLDFVGVPFEDACLEYHRTERSVRTPSSEQVRQPIYTSGLDYWRNYESSLAELKTSLAPQLDEYQGLLDAARGESAQNT